MNEEIQALQHEKKNLLIQLHLLQNRLTTNEVKMADTIQSTSSRQLPSIYRRTFERQLLSFHPSEEKPDEDIELTHDFEQKKFDEITHELNTLSLDQHDLYNLIGRTIIKINTHVNGSKKLVRFFPLNPLPHSSFQFF